MEKPTPWQNDLLEKLGNYEGVIIGPVYAELGRIADGRAEPLDMPRLPGISLKAAR